MRDRALRAEIEFRIVPYASPERAECVELRREVLRRPLGLDFTPEFLASESADTLIAAYASAPAGSLDGKKHLVACLLMSRPTDGVDGADATTMKMRQVVVAPNLQGQGIGTRLVLYAETCRRRPEREQPGVRGFEPRPVRS